MTAIPVAGGEEKEALLGALASRRQYLLKTCAGLTGGQARAKPTASGLSVGGLVKHVSLTERTWITFTQQGPDAFGDDDWDIDFSAIDWADPRTVPASVVRRRDGFTLRGDESLGDVVAAYREVAQSTEALIGAAGSLDIRHELPPAPWNEPFSTKSVREVLLHLIGETAQHCGHADIIRESIDGQQTFA